MNEEKDHTGNGAVATVEKKMMAGSCFSLC